MYQGIHRHIQLNETENSTPETKVQCPFPWHIWQNTFSLKYSTSTNHLHHQQQNPKQDQENTKKIKKLGRRKSYNNYLILNLIEDEREEWQQ